MELMTYENGIKTVMSATDRFRKDGKQDSCWFALYAIALYCNKEFRRIYGGKRSGRLDVESMYGIIAQMREVDAETKALKSLLPAYDLRVMEASPVLEDLFNALSELPDEWYVRYNSRVYDDIADRLAASVGKWSGEFIQPYEITKLVSSLAGYDGKGTVYNPYAGSASYAVALGARSGYVGEEVNRQTYATGVLRLIAHGQDPDMMSCKDSWRDWSGKSYGSDAGDSFDYIIATPPFGVRISAENRDPFRSFSCIEEDFLFRGALSLKENGTLVGIFPSRITFTMQAAVKNLRKELVESGMVSMVVLLPDGVFYSTGISTVLIRLRNRNEGENVTIVDARSFVSKKGARSVLLVDDLLEAIKAEDGKCVKHVSCGEIARNSYSLFPPLYTVEKESVPEGYSQIKVSDVLTKLRPRNVLDGKTIGRVLDLSALRKERRGERILPSELELKEIGESKYVMTSPFMAFSTAGGLRAAIVNASVSEPVFFSFSISAADVDTKRIYAPLLIREWKRKAHALVVGPVVDRNLVTDLEISVPSSVPDQISLCRKLEDEDRMAKARELGLEDLIAAQKRDFIQVLRSRKHDLSNKMFEALNSVSALKESVNNTEFDGGLMLKDMKLSEYVDITFGEQVRTLYDVLCNIGEKIKYIADEDEYGEVEKVDLMSHLRRVQNGSNYAVRLEMDLGTIPHNGKSILRPIMPASINGNDLDRVIENIVGNAVKHGFNNPDGNYNLVIAVSYDSDDRMYVIEFKNDGEPMPDGMDTERYGIDGEKGVGSTGNGKGGAIIKNTIEHFGGRYEVVNAPGDIFPVDVLIKLRKYED